MRHRTPGAPAGALFLALLGLPGLTAPAGAQDATCNAILDAVRRAGEAEQFHSTLLARHPNRRRPVEHERFVIGDVVYINSPAAGRWVKLPMTEADRRSLGAGLESFPPRDCREEERQEVGGVPMRVYAFHQILPGQNGAGEVQAPGRVWIAAADGRLRRYEGQQGAMRITLTFEFEGVTSPIGRQ